MANLKDLLGSYEMHLQNINAPILKKLQGGLSKEIVFNILEKQIAEHEDLVELYNWKNGLNVLCKRIIGETELFPDGIMLSVEEAGNVYDIYTQKQNLWSENFFPVFTNGGGNYLVFDFDSCSESHEMLLLYDPALFLGVEPITIYDSLESLIKTQSECLIANAYNFNLEGIDEINYDLVSEIAVKNNPKSKYWDDYR